MGLFGSDDYSSAEKHIPDDAGRTVKPKYVDAVSELLNEGEQVYHVIRGRDAGIGNTSRDAESKSQSTRAEHVTAAFTDSRVLIRVPHLMNDDQYIIRHQKIQGAELHSEGALGIRSVTIHTGGKSYFVSPLGTMDEGDLRDIIEYIDRKSIIGDEKPSSQNPKERLEDLNELYEDGIISESEFEEKKGNILDGM